MKELISYFIRGLICCFTSYFISRVKKITLTQAKSSKILKNLNGQVRISILSKNESGQVIVEYILLLLVSSAMALVLINLVSVDPSKSSPVFNYWKHLIEVIGSDIST